jgi:hypothetical protein
MSARVFIVGICLLGLICPACGDDPVVGSWRGATQNLSFTSTGKLHSLESAAVTQANAGACEAAGDLEEVEACANGDWTRSGEGYQIETTDLTVLDGGKSVNCTCTRSILYAELNESKLILYDRKDGLVLDRLGR